MNKIDDILKALKKEAVICMDTDTVPGLIGRASSSVVVKKIFSLKNRNSSKALSIMVSDIEMARKYGYLNNEIEKLLNFTNFSITVIVRQKIPTILARNINLKNQTEVEPGTFDIMISDIKKTIEIID